MRQSGQRHNEVNYFKRSTGSTETDAVGEY